MKKACRKTKVNIIFFTPYSMDGRLGRAYNDCMELVPSDEDWVCFLDRDAMFLTSDFGHQITEVIRRNPDAGLLTCLTNRIGCEKQLHQARLSDNPDVLHHQKIAHSLSRKHRHKVARISAPVSGFMMAFKKKTWKKVQFNEGLGLLGVDWDFSTRLAAKGFSILLLKGLYVFHYYRLDKPHADIAHLV